MNRNAIICAIAGASVLVSGCSTRPRNFTVELAAPVVNRMAFEGDFRTCQTLVRQGRKAGFKNAATGLAVGSGAVGAGLAVGSMTAGGVYSGYGAAGAAAGAALMATTAVIGIAGFGLTRLIRGGKERKYKRVMDDCLTEYGYSVDSWAKVNKKDDAAKIAASKATVQPLEPVVATTTVEPVAAIHEPETATLTPASALDPET